MKRKLFLVLNIVAFSVILNGQTISVYDTLNINFQWVAFFCDSSVQKYTRFLDDNGTFTFQEGHIDLEELDEGFVRHTFLQDGAVKSVIKKFHFINDVDTIYNYYLSKNHSCELEEDIRYNKLIGSYVLREAGYKKMDTTGFLDEIRILYPLEYLNLSHNYKIILVSISNNRVTLNSVVLRSLSREGFIIEEGKEKELSIRQLRRLKRQMQEVQLFDDVYCLNPGNPWIMEVNTQIDLKTFFISNYCLQQSRNLRLIGKLCFKIVQLSK